MGSMTSTTQPLSIPSLLASLFLELHQNATFNFSREAYYFVLQRGIIYNFISAICRKNNMFPIPLLSVRAVNFYRELCNNQNHRNQFSLLPLISYHFPSALLELSDFPYKLFSCKPISLLISKAFHISRNFYTNFSVHMSRVRYLCMLHLCKENILISLPSSSRRQRHRLQHRSRLIHKSSNSIQTFHMIMGKRQLCKIREKTEVIALPPVVSSLPSSIQGENIHFSPQKMLLLERKIIKSSPSRKAPYTTKTKRSHLIRSDKSFL